MRPDMGGGAVALLLIAVVLAAIYFAVRGIVRYVRRREAERKELLDLLRKQGENQDSFIR